MLLADIKPKVDAMATALDVRLAADAAALAEAQANAADPAEIQAIADQIDAMTAKLQAP